MKRNHEVHAFIDLCMTPGQERGQGSRRAVDLAVLDTFIEFKRRVGTAGGFNPNPEYVGQLDDYLEQSPKPLLLSLKPRYADLILEDVKKAELRTHGIPSRRQPGQGSRLMVDVDPSNHWR